MKMIFVYWNIKEHCLKSEVSVSSNVIYLLLENLSYLASRCNFVEGSSSSNFIPNRVQTMKDRIHE